MPSNGQKLGAYLLLALACAMWGSSFVLGKIAIREMPALDVSFWRSLFAAVIFSIVLIRRRPATTKRDLSNFVLVGALMIPLTYLLQFGALHFINAGDAAVIIGIEPLTIALASFIFFGSKLTVRILVASTLAAIGVYVLFRDGIVGGASSSWIGYAMVLASTVVVALWVVLTKKLLARFTPIVSTAFISVFGFVLLLVMLPWVDLDMTRYSAATWLSVATLTVSSSIIGNLLWNIGPKYVNSENAGVFLALEPVTGVLLAAAFLQEGLTGALISSLILVVFAILIATSRP